MKNEISPATLNIFRSKTRVALLVQFMLSSKDRFYMRELERDLGISIGNIRRELMNLENVNVLKSEKVGNLKYFLLDKESPIFKPIRELVIKTAGIPSLLEYYIKPNKNIIASFIYGSYVKGGFDRKSDIDLFIITKRNSSVFEEINSYLDKLEQRFEREINADTMLRTEFVDRISKNDPFVSDLIKGKKIFIKGGENDLQP